MAPQNIVKVPEEMSMMEMLRQILVAVRSARTQESVQNGSTFIKMNEWPKHLISIMDPEGQHKGFGSLLPGPKNRPVLITARHVLQDIRNGCILLGPSGITIKLPTYTPYFNTSLDLCGILIPLKLVSQLGCKQLTLASTPGSGTAVSVYGYYQGSIHRAIGCIDGPDHRMSFRHTASTMAGFSGTPIIKGDRTMVGIHLETCRMGFNYGLSLDFLVRQREESPGNGQRDRRLFSLYDEEDDELDTPEQDYLLFSEGNTGFTIRHRGNVYQDRDYAMDTEHYRSLAGRMSWEEEDDRDFYDEKVIRFNDSKEYRVQESAFRIGTGVPLNPPSSANTTGQPTTPPLVNMPQTSTSDSVVHITSPQVDSQANTVNRRQRKGKSTQNSTIGTGRNVQPTKQPTASTSTLPVSPRETESPPRKKKRPSSKLSKAQRRILELESQLALVSPVRTSSPVLILTPSEAK